MATVEESQEYLGSLAEYVDTSLARHGPKFAFTIVFWLKGEPDNAASMAIVAPPRAHGEHRTALLRASSVTKPPGAIEMHGLDTPERVCFYEQDFYVLSNFSAFAIELFNDGTVFPTVEHAYHWLKFFTPDQRMAPEVVNILHRISGARSAHEAFKLAQDQKALRRPDWDSVKVGIMADLLRAKVEQHEYVRRKLLATGERELVENSWRDDFWGWGQNRDGQNVLGRLWMHLRAELRGEVPEPVAYDL